MCKNDVTLSNIKETRTTGRLTLKKTAKSVTLFCPVICYRIQRSSVPLALYTTLCKAIHILQNDTCPTVIPQNCACVKQVLIGWKLIFGYTVQRQQIHRTVEQFSTNRNPGYRMSPSVWFVKNRLLYRPKIDVVEHHCIFKTLPQCYSRVLCTSNKRQCIERFIWQDALYIRLQVRHNENVGSTEGICFSEAFWQRWSMEGDFCTFDRSLRSRQNCFKGIKYTQW